METRKTPLVLTASALALALMLAGCGGGSSSSTEPTAPAAAATPPAPPAPPPEPEPETVTVSFADSADAMYLGDIDDVTTAVAIAAGETEDVGPYMVMNGGTATAMVTIEDGAVMVTGVDADDIDVTGFTMAAADDIKAAMDAAKDMTDEMKSRAVGVFQALDRSKWGGDSVRAIDPDPKASTGWTRVMSMKMNDEVGVDSKEETVVYHDRQPPTKKSYNATYYAGGQAATDNIPGTDVPVNNSGVAIAETMLTLTATANAPLPKAIGAQLDTEGGHFPESDGLADQKKTYGQNESDHPLITFDGTFHGMTGTYMFTEGCNDGCTVTAQADGTYTFSEDLEVTFTPDEPSVAAVPIPDGDYMQFGYWKKTPDTADSTLDYVYEINLIAHGSQAFTGSATAADGSATYKGHAVGLYSNKEEYGEFTADATLTAKFTAETDSLEGEIRNFQGGGDTDMTGWAVDLMPITTIAEGDSTTEGANPADNVSGGGIEAEMGDATLKNNAGSWDASLWGPAGTGNRPTGVTGRFNAEFTDARIVGAFGAQRTK